MRALISQELANSIESLLARTELSSLSDDVESLQTVVTSLGDLQVRGAWEDVDDDLAVDIRTTARVEVEFQLDALSASSLPDERRAAIVFFGEKGW